MEVIKEPTLNSVPNLEFLRPKSPAELADMIRNRRKSLGQPPLSEVSIKAYSLIIRNMLKPGVYEFFSDGSKTVQEKAQEMGVDRTTVIRYENVLGFLGLHEKETRTPHQKKILSALGGLPKSVSQISIECSLPSSTVYRTLRIFKTQELLEISGAIHEGGNRVYLYQVKENIKPSLSSQQNASETSVSKTPPKPQRLLKRKERELLGELPIPKLMEMLRASAKSEKAAKSEPNLKNLAWYAKRAISHPQFKHIANPFISNAIAAEKIGLKEDTLAKLRSSLIKLNVIMGMREAKLAFKPGREELLNLIRKSPKISRGEVERLGFSYEISKYFRANISKAKEAAKVPFVPRGRGQAHITEVKQGVMKIVEAYSPVRISRLRNLVPFDSNTLSRNLRLLRQDRKIALITLRVGGRGNSYGFYRLFNGNIIPPYETIITDFEPKSLEKLAKIIAEAVSTEARNNSGMKRALGRQLRQMNLPPGVYELVLQQIKGKN